MIFQEWSGEIVWKTHRQIIFSVVTRLKGAFSLTNLYFWDSVACSQRQFCIQLPCTSFYVGNDCNCPLFIKSEAEVMGGKWLGPLFYENNKVSKMGGSFFFFFPYSSHPALFAKKSTGDSANPQNLHFTLARKHQQQSPAAQLLPRRGHVSQWGGSHWLLFDEVWC